MTDLIPLAVAVLALIGSLYAVRVTRPKTLAEAKQAEAHATVDLISGFNALLTARQTELDSAKAKLVDAEQRAALVPVYARRLDEIEAELRAIRSVKFSTSAVSDPLL
ncbi:MAG: hypothetical protein A2Z17_07140 [Gammaproteobacteria bacterium RBG_16_66_13]|nr:MAG: hypothetical protein A2Z17_07140 [Gammaproteobacteria bacterium RBG_16_66_13]